MRIARFVAPAAAVAALALPQSPAQAVNTLAYSWVVHCNNLQQQPTPLLELPKGTYAVTVEGACTFGVTTTHSVPVSTCVNPLQSLPCVNTGAQVNNVPGATCYVGVGAAVAQTCSPGVYTTGATRCSRSS